MDFNQHAFLFLAMSTTADCLMGMGNHANVQSMLSQWPQLDRSCRLLSWNILAQKFARETALAADPQAPKNHWDAKARRWNQLHWLSVLGADLACLQVRSR
jgi:hypothetical protein